MKLNFIILRSVLLILFMYIGFILNNAFEQYITSQVLLSTFVLSLILSELLANSYKFLLGNQPDLKFYLLAILFSSLLLFRFSIILNYFVIFLSLLIHIYIIPLIANFFSIEDQLEVRRSDTIMHEDNTYLYERKGFISSYYIMIYRYPMTFLSTIDSDKFIEFFTTNLGRITHSSEVYIFFSLVEQGNNFLSNTKNNFLRTGTDLDKILTNFQVK